MLRVGLTGGIGAGKSSVADFFATLGAPIVDADEIAHALVAKGSEAYSEIVAEFGRDVLRPDGEVDRARLRERVFADPNERRRLEAIIHPRVRAEMRTRLGRIRAPYAILVIPLLIETRPWDFIDRVLVVDVEPGTQLVRVKRRGLNEEQARAILTSQASREERLMHADDVIRNEGSLNELRGAVEELHRRYLELPAATSDTRR